MKKLILYAFLFLSLAGYAQPANDDCSTATALGTLGAPPACGAGTQTGTVKTVAGTLTGATPASPYLTEGPCSSGTMASPANDVWYTFVAPANGPQATISVTGAAFTPNIAAWTGSCGNLVGFGCTVGTPGSATLTITGNLIAGQTYYIQISGNTGQSGAFTLHVNSFFVCGDCNTGSSFTATPLPVNGMYQPGQTVQFCYHVSSYDQLNTNWLHGVQFTYGSGWNAASITATPPPSCAGGGTWLWLPNGESHQVNGQTWGQGFYYDLNNDGDPTNNFGDNCSGAIANGTWNFCVSLTVSNACNPGANLSVTFNTSGDGESGSWTDNGCNPDPPTNFLAIQSCCPPTMSMTGATCGATGSATANAVVGGAGSQAPYVFQWTGPSGAVATNTVNPGTSNTINNLPAGTYTVVITDKNLCSSTNTIVVTGGASVTSAVTPHNITCAATGSITTTNASGGTAPYTYSWSGPGAFASGVQSPTGLTTAGVYTLTVTDHVGCTFTITANVAQTGTITVTVNSPTVCAGGSVNLTAGGATTYSWSTGATTNPITVTPGATSYTVVGTTGTCTNSAVSTVAVTALPVVTVNSATVCPGGSATLTGAGATTYTWNTGATTAAITASPGATTSFTVTGTTNTCTNSAVGTITVGGGITVNVNNATICAGTSTVLTASGGTTYSWTPAAGLSATTGATVTANPGATTTYTVTGTSAGCTGTVTSVVTVNPIPVVTASSTSVCAGNAGTITAGGATTYSWNTGATTAALTDSPIATTSYTVIGTTNTCTNSAVGTITVNPVPTLTVTSASICNGAGPATLGVSGASTYTWTGGGITGSNSTAPSDNPAATTVYTVNGTSAQSCTATATGTINVISTPTISVTGGAICKGQTTLTLTVNSNAATFAWSPATGLSATTGTAVVASPTTTQTYTIVGTAGTCTVSTTAVVTVNNPPVLATTSSTICLGQQTGTVTVNGASTYTWTGGGISGNTTTNPTDNPASTTPYTVNATDVNTCTATATATITVNPLPTVGVNSPSTCNGSTATLTATGATTYSWTAGLSATTGTSVTGSPATTTPYTVTGTDANGCKNTAVATINVIGNPTLTVNSGPICAGQTTLALTATSNANTFAWTPATGLSATTGSLVTANPAATQVYTITGTAAGCTVSTTATVTVNTPPTLTTTSSTICVSQQTGSVTVNGASTYTWTGGGINGNTTTNPTDNPVATTIYTVNAADINTCTATATATITVNPLPVVTVNSSAICLGQQTATLTAVGASTYSWTPGLSSTSGSTVTGSPAVTTSYTVTGTDLNGCTDTSVATITVISNPTITVANGAMCVGQQTVTLTANSNATSFVWSPATGLSATTGSSVTANPTTIGPNVYTVVGTVGSCTVSTTVTVTVYALPVPTASANVPCETENALNLTSTPAGTYTYTWSGPNSFTSTIQNPSITILNNVTQAVAGPYTVTVTDPNSCYNSASVTVVVNPKPTITATGATVCVGQTINLTSNGAGAGGNYSWSGQGGVYSSGQQNPSITNAATGMTSIYNVVGTDANGCYNGAAVQVQVNPLPIITVTTGTICVGQQTATLIASSSNTGTNYSWTPATGLSATTGSTVVSNPSPAGTYTYLVTGTDANTCVGTSTTSVVVNPLPTITANSSTICVGQQTATLTANSTNPGTTYSWAPATGLSSSTATVVTGTPTVTTNYIITGTDGNGCVSTGNTSILVNILPTITATSGTICIGQTTNLTASSTNAGTTYSWTPATGLVSTTGATVAASPTPSGTYSYVVIGTDGNGCINTGSSHVLVYALPVVNVVTSGPICVGQQTATLTASGASAYSWTPSNTLSNSTGASVFGFPATIGENDYTVTATDIHNCVNTATTSIWVNSLPTVTIHTVTPECVPFCPTLTATPTLGSGPYSYSWSFGTGQTSLLANPTPCYSVAGVFAANLLITDANGCTTTASTPVNALSIPTADFDYGQQPVSILSPEVQFTNQSTYGLPIHNWFFGDVNNTISPDTSSVNNPTHTYLEVGTYNVTLTVSTLNGCSATVTKPVIINEDYALYVPNAFSPNGDGKNEFFKAEGEGVKDYKLFVFDRWGLLLFYSDDINKGWDGKIQGSGDLVQEDVYVWKIQTTDFTNKSKNLHGTVTLLK